MIKIIDFSFSRLFISANSSGDLLEIGVLKSDLFEANLIESIKNQQHQKKALETIQKTEHQLSEYAQGKRTVFDVPINIEALHGTVFQKKVWAELLKIPFGTTDFYADIAQKIENAKAVRAVGGAIGKNPLLIVIPCHRILGKNGSLTGFSAGIELKKILLNIEKIQILSD